LGVDELVAG
jgi:hypothetical protein